MKNLVLLVAVLCTVRIPNEFRFLDLVRTDHDRLAVDFGFRPDEFAVGSGDCESVRGFAVGSLKSVVSIFEGDADRIAFRFGTFEQRAAADDVFAISDAFRFQSKPFAHILLVRRMDIGEPFPSAGRPASSATAPAATVPPLAPVRPPLRKKSGASLGFSAIISSAKQKQKEGRSG